MYVTVTLNYEELIFQLLFNFCAVQLFNVLLVITLTETKCFDSKYLTQSCRRSLNFG